MRKDDSNVHLSLCIFPSLHRVANCLTNIAVELGCVSPCVSVCVCVCAVDFVLPCPIVYYSWEEEKGSD